MGISTTMSHCDLKMFASPQPCDKEQEKEREGDGVGEREMEKDGGRRANSNGDGANNMWPSVWHKCSLCM